MLSTTQLLVEHIISGLLAMIWIGIGLLLLIDMGVVTMIDPLLDNWSVVILFLGAIAYPVGLIVDEIADQLLGGWNRSIKRGANIAEDKSTLQYLSEIKNENTPIPFDIRITDYIPINLIPFFVIKPRCSYGYSYVLCLDRNQIPS